VRDPGWPPALDDDIPASRGIPNLAKVLMIGAVLIILAQGSFVVMSSVFGRVWPAASSTKVQLP
jgi:hypothetical protein